MDFLNALSECWWLGQQCVPSWNAWAGFGALASVATTGILGMFTYRLGKAANRASDLAVELAANEYKRQEQRDSREQVLVLMQIAGEITTNRKKVLEIIEHLSAVGSQAYLMVSREYRADLLANLKKISFPLTADVTDRLHYLDSLVGATLVRATAMFSSIQAPFLAELENLEEEERRQAHEILTFTLSLIAEDLELVRLACEAAIKQVGIDDARVARQALALAK